MYSLLDHTAQVFLNPLSFTNDAEAIRWFTTTKKIVQNGDRTQDTYWIDTETGETNYDPIAYKKGLLMQSFYCIMF